MTDKPNIPPQRPGEGSREYRNRISGGKYKKNRKFPQSKVNKPKPKPTDNPPPDMEEFYKGPSKEVIEERQKAIDKIRRGNPTDEEIQEALREDDYKRGDYLLPDGPSNAFKFRDGLKIIQQLNTVRNLPYKAIGGTVRNLLLINQGINQPI